MNGVSIISKKAFLPGSAIILKVAYSTVNGSCSTDLETLPSVSIGEVKWCRQLPAESSTTFGVGVQVPSACLPIFDVMRALRKGMFMNPCGTGEYQGARKYEAFVKKISDAFAGADFPKTILLLVKYFGASTYSLTSLFADARRKVLDMIMEPTLREAEAAYSAIYKHHAPLIRFLKGSGTPLPKVLSAAADLYLNAELRRVLQGEGLDPEVVRPLLEEARLAGATLDAAALGCCWHPTSSVWPKNFLDTLTTYLSWKS